MNNLPTRWSTPIDNAEGGFVTDFPMAILTNRTLPREAWRVAMMYFHEARIQSRNYDGGNDRGNITKATLAKNLGVARKTVERNAEVLRLSGLVLMHDRRGEFRLCDHGRMTYLHYLMLWPTYISVDRGPVRRVRDEIVKLMADYETLRGWIPAFLDTRPSINAPSVFEIWANPEINASGILEPWKARLGIERVEEDERGKYIIIDAD